MAKINKRLEEYAFDIIVDNDALRLPVDLISIANNNGIEVYRKKLPDEISGAIRYNEQTNKFQILLEESDSFTRQRFTLAHELAHFFLEKNKLQNSKEIHFDTRYRKIKDSSEREVDYLAGALLMNQAIVKELYEIKPSVSHLANIFKVSESAMQVRLKMLGLK